MTGLPPADLFKPAGVPMRQLETVDLAIDELEALRLVDHEGLSHEEAAHYLGVSRQTAGRVVESARRKVAEALLGGKALAIGGGAYRVAAVAHCCEDCGTRWAAGDDAATDERCPSCGSTRVGVCRGYGSGHGHGRMQGGARGGGHRGDAPGRGAGPGRGGGQGASAPGRGAGQGAGAAGRGGGRGRGAGRGRGERLAGQGTPGASPGHERVPERTERTEQTDAE